MREGYRIARSEREIAEQELEIAEQIFNIIQADCGIKPNPFCSRPDIRLVDSEDALASYQFCP